MFLFLRKKSPLNVAVFAALVLGVGLLFIACSGSSPSDDVLPVTTQQPVMVTFSGFGDEEITLTQKSDTPGITVGTELTVTVTESFDFYEWFLDGAKQSSTGGIYTLTIPAYPYLTPGKHTLTVIVEKDDKPYSKALTFTVE